MHSVQTGMWDPRPPSKHASPLPQPPPSNLRLAHVTTATPAKRLTFYKSGDSQFGGIRMAVHKRSFKCFDALLDDLSQKVPLPFGVRTVTTPRGTHTIKHLEQLQDGGCYLCSDRRQAKPVNMELASKRPTIWYHHSHRPHRPESSSATPPGHLPYRQRRILLVKNSEPGMRRSVVLSRRSTRSLRAFLEEVSDVMQFHVRKLYTAEGRRIDSVQSLITCPGVLVCVGREAFSPMLVNFIRKSSEEKLPGLGSRSPGLGPRTPGNGARSPATQGVRSPPHGAHSRASEYSEGQESKKNVNFGLETKKSIIHPRSDSSNRSTRFSLSSEKSYGNGVSAYSQARPAIMNEDIEKRVLVNKDGSLSVEMRVRFRLHNDETLQWSTQIKKSPSLTNELSQPQSHYLQQGQSESCSDPDSASFEPEGVGCSNQTLKRVSEGNHCPCCYQRQQQQYDLWENPVHSHKKPPFPPPHTTSHTMMRHTHSSSSSSSCNSRRVVRCRARLSNCGGGSGSEQSQLVQEEMCLTEQVERRVEVEGDGDAHVKVCRVSQCCSRSEVVATDGNLRPLSQKSVEDELMMDEDEGGGRPLSAISNSSHILQSLKEDEDDLPRSASQCCNSNEPSPSPTPETDLNNKPTRSASAGSVHSTQHTKLEDREARGSRAATPYSTAEAGEMDRPPSSRQKMSRASCTSSKAKIPTSGEEEEVGDDEDEEIKRVVSGLSSHTGLSAGSLHSRASSVCSDCGGCKGGVNSVSNSRASRRSHHSPLVSPKPPTENANNDSDDDGSDVSAVSTQSNKSNLTNYGPSSAISNVQEGRPSSVMSTMSDPKETTKEEEVRAPSATSAISHRSNRSHRSGCNGSTSVTAEKGEERSPSAMSAKSHKSNCSGRAEAPEEAEGASAVERPLSVRSGASSKISASVKLSVAVASPTNNPSEEEDDTNKRTYSALSVKSRVSDNPGKAERPDSVLSTKSAKSTKSRSTCSHCSRGVSPAAKEADDPAIEVTGQEEDIKAEERAASAMSAKSNKSHKSTPRSETGGDLEKRAVSQMSGTSVKSNMSVKSAKSAAAPSSKVGEKEEHEIEEEEQQQKAESVMSAQLENEERAASAGSSESHRSNSNENPGASSETGDNTAQDRAASALSCKSASSAKSHHTNCVASPIKDIVNTEVNHMEDRSPSARSGKSHTSAKSSKSHKSNHTAASPNPTEADGPSNETIEEDNQNEERVASAMSAKSKSSVRSSTSHKSNSSNNLKSMSPNPHVVTIKTPEGVDEGGNDTTERAQSAASAKSASSALSHKSNHNGTAGVAVNETADSDEKIVEDKAPRSKSSQTLSPRTTHSTRTHSPKAPATSPSSSQSLAQQLFPALSGGETRGPSALSVRSTTSAKSSRSKCRCGAASAREKAKIENKEEEKQDDTKEKSEVASERAASILSSSTQRPRRQSGGTEQSLSRNSSGSVSLGLPEDQETAESDSGKSTASFRIDTDRKGQVKTATPDVRNSTEQSATKVNVNEGTVYVMSQNSNNGGSKSNLLHNPPAVDIPIIETPGGSEDKGEEGGEQKTVRSASALSAKGSHKSSCKCSVKAAASVKSASSNMDTPDNRTCSAMSSASAKVRSKSPTCVRIKNADGEITTTGDSGNKDNENQPVSRPASKAEGKEHIADSKSPCCLRPESAALLQSDSLNPVKVHKAKSNSSVKSSICQKKEIKSSSPCPSHSSRLCSKGETCSESTLSHSLSAADLLKETMAAAHPHSRQSNTSNTSDKPRSEKGVRCEKSRNQVDQEDLELTPACLPNVSPNEVVSDWLRSIPANSSLLELGDELHVEQEEKVAEEKPEDQVAREEESPEDENVDMEEKAAAEDKEEEAECDAAEEEKSSDPTPADSVRTVPRPNTLLSSGESLPRNWHSSAAVMKVLLSTSMGRCQSMPEVSPVYGHRLSTSARGFLDCLAQLQLIEPVASPGCDQQKDRSQRYEDIMAILQSLWLTEPRDFEAKESKDVGVEQVTPPRSSSGVDMSSGSGGSGKENENQGRDETKQNKSNEAESLHEDEGAEKVVEEEKEGDTEAGHTETEAEVEDASTEQDKTNIAGEPVPSEEQSTVPQSLDSPKTTENPSSSDKSSANDSSKSPTDNEHETLEDSSSGTPPTVLRAPLSKKISQDPDPVWVLHLLKKLEKQFMNHYINAMAEFKVRWDLDDSLILDTMISELRDEVSRRIQSSIEREVRKIQGRAGRAGRSPRPPQGGNLSRESTMTEKRRRILKVMKNQSVKTADSLSDGELTGEFSDQRSDDEYCPCDACVRKKMAARPLKATPLAAEAPVMMEFDLLKILQRKKVPSPATVPLPTEEEGDSMVIDDEGRNLEVVQEEEEESETKEDIKAVIVLEETIPEEDEEIEKEDGGEVGEEVDGVGEEEQEGEAGEKETSECGEEEEKETQCQCQCAGHEEESDKAEEGEEAEGEDAEQTGDTGEDETADDEERAGEAEDEGDTGGNEEETGTGEEEEESVKETVNEATTGEGETTDNSAGEEEQAEVEECAVSEFKPEAEEETTGRESGEEGSGETADEEPTPAEEFVEGNISGSAEAEDEGDGDDGTGQGESNEDATGGESEEPERESEEESASPQGQGVTEGEEADAEDSDTNSKRPTDTSADESACEGPKADEEERGSGGDGCEEEVVEEFKPEEEQRGEVKGNKVGDGALLHQFTRTSVESQPGSLEDIDTDSPQNPVNTIEVPKMAAGVSSGGGAGQRRSRSPARVKRRKPKESDVELDDF